MAVVEHVAHHHAARRHQAERPGGRHAEVRHGLAAQELAHRAAQHGQAVGGAGIRRGAGALELQGLVLAVAVNHFAERDRTAVAELTGPVAELVAAIAVGMRIHAVEQGAAAEHRCELRIARQASIEAEQVEHLRAVREQVRCGHRCRFDSRVARAHYLPAVVAGVGVGGKRGSEAIVEAELVERADRHRRSAHSSFKPSL